MNIGSIWWNQIGNSLRLLTHISNTLHSCRSAVLQVPGQLPWRQDFYDAVDLRRVTFSAGRRMKRLAWNGCAEPGEFILNELCPPEIREEYWPGDSYAKYLAAQEGITLNDCYVWVTGIHTKDALAQWTGFAAEYARRSGAGCKRAVFVLEYDGDEIGAAELPCIPYTVELYDCRVFCLEAAAAFRNTELPAYQAELAVCLCGGSPEVASALLARGDALLRDPVRTAAEVLQTGRFSDGGLFAPLSEQQLLTAVRKAAIVLLFPILEQYRLDFITTHERTLKKRLPISNSNGDRITDPYDLEIGPLNYIVSSAAREFSPDEAAAVKLLAKTRNLLAHNKIVPYQSVKSILAL